MKTMLVHQIDSMFGSSRMARYRAGVDANPGCGYSSDAAVYGYDNFVVPDVKRAHPDWTADQVTREALILFNLRFSENIASLRQEQKGESSTTVWREEIFDGARTLVIHGGKYDGYTLDRFWDESLQYDQEKGTARSGNIEEHHAQKRIQQAILNGEATSSASIIGHPESVKLIQTFHRGSDGLYYSEQIDLEGLTGRTLTFAEGKAVMAALHHDHKQSAKIAEAHHDHFMVTKGEITASEVKTIARAVVITSRETKSSREQSKQSDLIKQTDPTHDVFTHGEAVDTDCVRGNMLTDTSQTVFRDTGEAISKMVTILRDKEKRKEVTDRLLGLSIVQKIRRIFEKGDQSVDNNNAAALLLSTNQKDEGKTRRPNVRPERLTIEKIREKPERIVEVIEKRHEKMRKGMAMLGVIAETSVAIHASPVILARLKEKLPTPVVAMKKSIERHAKKELRKKKKDSVKVQPLKTERVEPLRAVKERKKKKIRVKVDREVKAGNRKEQGSRVKRSKEKGTKRIAAASEIILSASKKRERREKRKMRKAVEKSMRRHKKKELRMENKVQPLIEKKRSIQKKEREAVGEMVFGWMVWMLFVRKEIETPKRSFIRSDLADLQGPTLQSKEDVPWVLLSIIYYLTAIREQGMQSNPTNPTNTPIRPKKNARVVPQYAVIFAYNS